MSGLIIIHKPYQEGESLIHTLNEANEALQKKLVWQTCRREILFCDEHLYRHNIQLFDQYEIYENIEAEAFLIEVLCGLKSPLVGETEVFGQFKNWWQSLDSHHFKQKFNGRIQHLYSVVKKIREESLCGMGSQSYGSLLRKKIEEYERAHIQNTVIDFIGAGQLVQEMVPWVQKKWTYQVRCRQPAKARHQHALSLARHIQPLDELTPVSPVLVVAAPLSHQDLQSWIIRQDVGAETAVFDFRHDSATSPLKNKFKHYVTLNDLTLEVQEQRAVIETQVRQAHQTIRNWVQSEMNRAQVRPFGWDDL